MRHHFGTILPLLTAVLFLGACDDDPIDPGGPFDLTFEGDATFQGAHGGQDISVALVTDVGTVLDVQTGTVSESDDPSFSFTFSGQLVSGEAYAVDYWIDSNFQGGTEGTCDAPEDDHQWHVDLGTVEADVNHVETHEPGAVTDVCDSF